MPQADRIRYFRGRRTMNFNDNPFFLLDASSLDSKEEIHEKAEDKSFELEEETCRNAERILLNPKKRLEAEISWFPGMSLGETHELLSRLRENAGKGIYGPAIFQNLNELSHANALAYFLSNASADNFDQNCVKEITRDFCVAANRIDCELVLQLINDDRAAADFPKLFDEDAAEQSILDLVRWYKQILYSEFLVYFDSRVVINIMTQLIEEETGCGRAESNWRLLDDIIMEYETEVTSYFEKKEEMICSDIDKINESVSKKLSREILSASVEKLEHDVRSWDRVAQPIQVLYKSRGREHKRSSVLAQKLRDLSISIYNEHELVELSKRITLLLSEVFAEVPVVAEIVKEDLKFLGTSGNDRIILCELEKITKKYDTLPLTKSSAEGLFHKCWDEAMPIASKMYDVAAGKNHLAYFFLGYIVKYANSTKDYQTCLKLIMKVQPLITDEQLLEVFEENLAVIQKNSAFVDQLTTLSKKERLNDFLFSVLIYAIPVLVFGVIGSIVGCVDGKSLNSAISGFGSGVIIGMLISFYLVATSSTRRH